MGEPIRADLFLENTTADYLWVNTRMAHDASWVPAGDREVDLEVVGPDGKKIWFHCMIDRGRLSTKHYVVLRPGESAEARLEMGCYDFHRPGLYAATAFYQDCNPTPPPPPSGAVPLDKTLRSAPVTFEVATEKWVDPDPGLDEE